MKTIIITGPSGSGKSYLSHKLLKEFYNSIIIRTDSYYMDSFLIRFLSTFIYDIYDRRLSIRKKEIMKTLRSIHNKDKLISIYKYDFKRKYSSQSKVNINYTEDNQFLILEGIFAHKLDLNYKETVNIVCDEKKEICLSRRLNRDKLERDRNSVEVYKKFNRSWYLFYENIQSFRSKNKIYSINTLDINSFNKLVINLQTPKKNN